MAFQLVGNRLIDPVTQLDGLGEGYVGDTTTQYTCHGWGYDVAQTASSSNCGIGNDDFTMLRANGWLRSASARRVRVDLKGAKDEATFHARLRYGLVFVNDVQPREDLIA